MIDVRRISKLISKVKESIGPKVYFKWIMTKEDLKEVEEIEKENNKSVIMSYEVDKRNKVKTGFDYLSKEEQEEYIKKMALVPGGEYYGKKVNN